MFPVVHKRQLSEAVWEMGVEAPRLAARARAGQFLMLRIDDEGERIPLTFSDWSAEEGWVRFIFMRVGKTTHQLAHVEVGEALADVVGPLGIPTHTDDLGRVVVVGGGVGAAVAYPVARAMLEAGNDVSVILGARNEALLILEDEFRALGLSDLIVMTDDGSAGRKGLVTAPLKELCEAGKVDHSDGDRTGDHDEVLRCDDPRCRCPVHGEPQPDHGGRDRHVRSVSRVGGWRDQVRLCRRPGFRRPRGRLRRAHEPPARLHRR